MKILLLVALFLVGFVSGCNSPDPIENMDEGALVWSSSSNNVYKFRDGDVECYVLSGVVGRGGIYCLRDRE